MGEVKLIVPPEYVESFRLAAAHELGNDAEWIVQSQEEMLAALSEGRFNDHATDDLRTPVRGVHEILSLVNQLHPSQSEAVELSTDADVLAHTAETMARKVVGAKLTGLLACGPMDSKLAAEVGGVVDSLLWAVGRAAELHERAGVT